jgi:hypothetical protein
MNGIGRWNKLRHEILNASVLCIYFVWATTACTDTESISEVSLSDVPISLTTTRATTASTTGKANVPCFVSWLESDFSDESWKKSVQYIASDLFTAEPFFSLNASDDIDNYKTIPFNTGCYYPAADQSVYIAGYYPAESLQKVTGYYAGECMELVSTASPGSTDILVSTKTLKGSASAPLDADDASLTFNHALAKITFKAKLHENMTKYISNVKLTLPATGQLMRGLYASYENREGQIFQPYAWQEGTGDNLPEWTSETLTKYLLQDEEQELGTVYIVPGYGINVDINYRYSEKGTTYEDLSYKGLEVLFADSNESPIRLESGDSYEVTLSFLENVIEITGKPVDWVEGGEIYIPLYPYKKQQQ